MDIMTTPMGTYTGNMHAENAKNIQKQAAVSGNNEAQIYEKARELEGQFLSTMIEPLFSKDKEGGLFGGGAGNDVFRSLMMNEYGQILSQAGGIGLADNIAKEMLALQEVQQ